MKLLEFNETEIGNPAMVQVLNQIDKHAQETNQRLFSIETKMDVVASAFPARDFEGHRRYHQSLIDVLEERRAFYRSLKEKTITGLVWATVVWIGVAAWHELTDAVKYTMNMK